MKISETHRQLMSIMDEVDRAVVGRRAAVEHLLVAILASGHVLLEDLPGLGKTQIARCLATVLGLQFNRMQFTPDLLPSDLTGSSLFDPRTQEFTFHRGPIFTQLLLADEINRTPPKTQSALLEAMQEGQVSMDGVTTRLDQPFIVLATDNPVEYEGTYPLPEAQLDRFAIRLSLGYLPVEQERAMLQHRLDIGASEVALSASVDAETVLAMRASLEDVYLDSDIVDYVLRLVVATREHDSVTVGASPRAGLMLLQLARGRAVLSSRDFVTADDVKVEALPALAHRLTLRPELWVRRVSTADVVTEVLDRVAVPPTDVSVPDRDRLVKQRRP